ncbi:MAG: endolytic transglycosylase MltG [bacterium]|nr:endolytic transglycosylase MltG [bacterium]
MLKKIYIAVVVAITAIVIVMVYFFSSFNGSVQSVSQEVLFTIDPGQGVSVVGQNLADQNLIASKFNFEMYIWLKNWGANIQAGDYVLDKKMTIAEISKTLVRGEALSNEKIVKIIEGWRASDIADYLETNNIASGALFSKLVNCPKYNDCVDTESADVYTFLKEAPGGAVETTLEGFLFPDTYRVFKDANAGDIIAKMLNNFSKKLTPQMREDIAKQNKSVYEIITMASIIEREVRSAEDMKVVSGIFWNRLGIDMALQSDATLSYYLKDKKPAHNLAELETDTPFNTYKYRGLPPAPISNPGLNAITAAIYPDDTNYLYFLNNLETGQSYFAETLDEHNKNKALYLR